MYKNIKSLHKLMVVKTFKGALKSKINHSKMLEVTGQGEILAYQDFDHGCISTYSACVCDTPLHKLGFMYKSSLE